MTADTDKWNRIYRDMAHRAARPAKVLADNVHLLPASGDALDLACGDGGNAMLLAASGLHTTAWDISVEALKRLGEAARSRGLNIDIQERDVVAHPPVPASFDIITVSRFLDRDLVPDLTRALRPAGLIFYQTFAGAGDTGPRNPAYRLQCNELLKMFGGLQIILYREEGELGDTTRGFRDEAMLIARKPEN